MKTKLFFAIIILSASVISIAQNATIDYLKLVNNQQQVSSNILLRTETAKIKLDSVISDNKWKHVFTYDDIGNNTFFAIYNWDSLNNVWYGDQKFESRFDNSGDRIMFSLYSWDKKTNQWVGINKNEHTNDEKGSVSSAINYSWDVNLNQWVVRSKVYNEYVYDSNNQVIESITYIDSSGTKLKGTKSEFAYFSNGHGKSTKNYTWDKVSNNWIGDSWTEIEYDTNDYNNLLEANYSWDRIINKWIGNEKTTNKYDLVGNNTLQVTYDWDLNKNQWIEYKKVENQYDLNKNNTLNATYVWDANSGKWIGNEKNEYLFNSSKKYLIESRYKWNTIINQWEGSDRNEYIYDSLGNILKEISPVWSKDSNDWVYYTCNYVEYIYDLTYNLINSIGYEIFMGNRQDVKRTEYTYDSNGKKTLEISYDLRGNQSYVTSKVETIYDTNNNLLFFASYNWDSNIKQWVGSSKVEYAYDIYSNQTLIARYDWNQNTRKWVGSNKWEYGFDANKNQTKNATYSWDINKETWKGESKDEKAFNSVGDLKMSATYTWDDKIAQWTGKYKNEVTYDTTVLSNDIISLFNNYKFKTVSGKEYKWDNGWAYSNEIYYYYSDFETPNGILNQVVAIDGLNVFPIPTSDYIKVENVSPNSICTLIDSHGRSDLLTHNFGIIDISNYKSGYYTLLIEIDGLKKTCKVIKN